MSAKMTDASTKPQPHVQKLYNSLFDMVNDERVQDYLEQVDPNTLAEAEEALAEAVVADPTLVGGWLRSPVGASE